jgi:hypothetical protein
MDNWICGMQCLGCECEKPVQNGGYNERLCLPIPTQRLEGTTIVFTALASRSAKASAIGVRINRTDRQVCASRNGIVGRTIDMSSVSLRPNSFELLHTVTRQRNIVHNDCGCR